MEPVFKSVELIALLNIHIGAKLDDSGSTIMAVEQLLRTDLIKQNPSDFGYLTTDKGNAMVRKLRAVTLPVPTWS